MDPTERTRRAAHARNLIADLASRGVAAVATTWVDTSGISRVKAVPLERLERAAGWGIGASPVFDTFLLDDVPVSGRLAGGPVGDLRLHPDLARLVPLVAQPGWAWAPADRYTLDGRRHAQDHRGLLAGQVELLARDGFSVRAAFEAEWAVSIGTGDEFVPACKGPAYGMTRLVEQSDYLRDVLVALTGQGIVVEQIHPEYAAGQYEVSVTTEDPVGAADTAVLVRETIRAVTAARGMRATFAPKVLVDGVGNGGHVHLSLWQDGGNTMAGGEGPHGMTGAGEAFTAGILARLPALLAVGAPTVSSYLRLVPSHWAGVFACWGVENREAALRFVTGAHGEGADAANLEIKCVDPAANPYLLLASVLAVGRAGLGEAAHLPAPVEVDPATLPEAVLADRGIRRLPTTLSESVVAFEADAVLAEALGEVVVDTVATVRRGEIAKFTDAAPEEIVAATRWVH